MHPRHHTFLSAVTGAIFGFLTHSIAGSVMCFLSGIFIDLDHILDYVLSKKKIPFKYKDLDYFCAREREPKFYIFLHSFEFLFLFFVALIYFNANFVWWGTAIGLVAHLLADQLANPLRPLAMFFFYRLKHKFSREYIFPDGYWEQFK